MLGEAQLSGLTNIIMAGIEGLAGQAAPSGSALNDKFQKTGSTRGKRALSPSLPTPASLPAFYSTLSSSPLDPARPERAL